MTWQDAAILPDMLLHYLVKYFGCNCFDSHWPTIHSGFFLVACMTVIRLSSVKKKLADSGRCLVRPERSFTYWLTCWHAVAVFWSCEIVKRLDRHCAVMYTCNVDYRNLPTRRLDSTIRGTAEAKMVKAFWISDLVILPLMLASIQLISGELNTVIELLYSL